VGTPAPSVITNSEQPVREVNTGPDSGLARLNWDHLRLFLSAARTGSFRAAAAEERISVNAVRARIARLEAQHGAPLLRRSRTGVSATAAGEDLLRVAADMGHARRMGDQPPSHDVLVHPNQLTIACTEGLGSLWLTPRLLELQQRLDGLTVNLQYDYDLERDRSAEADIGLTYGMPLDPDLIVCKLATLHFMLFASESYVRRHGRTSRLEDLLQHRFVEQAATGVNSRLLDLLVGGSRPPGFISVRTNSSVTQFWAIVNGAGIGALPSYARALTNAVVPLDPPLQMRFELRYFFHAGARNSPAVIAGIEWLRRAFDAQANPWFADQFVHPRDFAPRDQSAKVVTLFDGMGDMHGSSQASFSNRA